MLKRARGINQYGSLRLSISLDNLVLLTELIKLYIKAYLQKKFETICTIFINNGACSACNVAIVIQGNCVVHDCISQFLFFMSEVQLPQTTCEGYFE